MTPDEKSKSTEALLASFRSIFHMDSDPFEGDDLSLWMVEYAEATAKVLHNFDLPVKAIAERIRFGIQQSNDGLLELLENDEGIDLVWGSLEKDDPEYPFLDLRQMLTAIADELETPGTTRRRLTKPGLEL